MALTTYFSDTLQILWELRTANITEVVAPTSSRKPRKFDRDVRDEIVCELLDTASEILVKRDARQEFQKIIKHRYRKHLTGRGVGQKAQRFVTWVKESLSGPIIYSFWKGSRCLYVGKGMSPKRLTNYEKSIYMAQADRVQVFCVTTQSNLGKAECLATHLFVPRDNRIKASRQKWGKACPVCSRHDYIRDQLDGLCRLR